MKVNLTPLFCSKLPVLISCIFLCSCLNLEKEAEMAFDYDVLEKFLENTTGSPGITKEAYLIIPVDQGCSSCISKSLLFAQNNMDNSKFVIVLSSSSSKNIKKVLSDNFPDQTGNGFIHDPKFLARTFGVTAFPIILYTDGAGGIESISLDAGNIDAELRALSDRIE